MMTFVIDNELHKVEQLTEGVYEYTIKRGDKMIMDSHPMAKGKALAKLREFTGGYIDKLERYL